MFFSMSFAKYLVYLKREIKKNCDPSHLRFPSLYIKTTDPKNIIFPIMT